MSKTNSYGSETAILYARVSGRGQVEEGHSLDGQLRELRAWAEHEGVRVLEEVKDGAFKRDTLDRPGINRILDICEERRVDVVMSWQRDRFGEYPLPDVLTGQLARHGTMLRSLDDSGEGEAGELHNMFNDWMARRERRKTAKRSRMGKLEKARSGYVVASHTPTYGFEYSGPRKRRTYKVREEHMRIVRYIFRMMAVERLGIHAVARRLNQEGVPTPPTPTKRKNPERGRDWSRQFIRACILNDAYKPHTPEEIAALVEQGFMSPDVAALLDPEELYSIWWYIGKDYDGNHHRVAVPVCDAGIPREWVNAGRKILKANLHRASTAGGRECWELSHGFLICAGCGRRMQTHAIRSPRHGTTHLYYRCATIQETTKEPCPANVRLSAKHVEAAVWNFIAGLSASPEQIVTGLDRLIEKERSKLRGDPDEEIRALHGRLEALGGRRGAYQDQQAAGYMTLEELGAKLEELEEVTKAVERELEACKNRGERVRQLEETQDLFAFRGASWGWLEETGEWTTVDTPDGEYQVRFFPDEFKTSLREAGREGALRGLKQFTPEQRRQRYRELELRVVAHSKEEIEVNGLFDTETVYISASSPTPSIRP